MKTADYTFMLMWSAETSFFDYVERCMCIFFFLHLY